MLSPKTSKVLLDPGVFNDEKRNTWLPILVGSRLYREAPMNFPDLANRLAAVEDGSLRAKQLNETLRLIDKIGPVEAGINNNQGEYSTLDNREGLIEYALSVLYGNDFLPRFTTIQSGMTPNEAVI